MAEQLMPRVIIAHSALPSAVKSVYAGRRAYLVEANYEGIRGDLEHVRYLGRFVTMWANADGNSRVVKMLEVDESLPDGLDRCLAAADRSLAGRCLHDDASRLRELSAEEARARGVPHFGACYHIYACECGATFAQDSSD